MAATELEKGIARVRKLARATGLPEIAEGKSCDASAPAAAISEGRTT